jgi:hypothetical protein
MEAHTVAVAGIADHALCPEGPQGRLLVTKSLDWQATTVRSLFGSLLGLFHHEMYLLLA